MLYEKNVIIEEKIPKSNGEILTKRYLRGRFLGKGGFSCCYEVTELHSKKVYAAKIISKSTLSKNKARQKLISEIKIHKSLQHPGIVSFEHVFEDQENVYILLELCANQSLKELLKRRKRLSEIEVQCYCLQILEVVGFIHSKNVIHRETVCGTPNYIAPEVLPEHNSNGHSFKFDVWSFGVMMYTLLVGKPAFEASDVQATYKRIIQRSYSFPENIAISEDAKALIKKIFVLEDERMSLEEIYKHPFLARKAILPRTMPLSTLSCPPSMSFINSLQFPGSEDSARKSLQVSASGFFPLHQAPVLETNENLQNPDENPAFTEGYFRELKAIKKTPILQPEVKNFLSESSRIIPLELPEKSPQKREEPSLREKLLNAILVTRWLDYSGKYGVGYLLSDGSVGVCFNDSSKMLIQDGEFFFYFEKRKDSGEQMLEFHIHNCPGELERKALLLKHFRSYLKEKNESKEEEKSSNANPQKMVVVKKWMKTKQAIMFRLSNKLIQVIFADQSQLVLSSDEKLVLFINKNSEKKVSPLLTALEEEDPELSKWLKYTREILAHMVVGQQKEKKM